MKEFWQKLKLHWLQFKRRRAIKKHDHNTYFDVVRKLAKIEVDKMIKEKKNGIK